MHDLLALLQLPLGALHELGRRPHGVEVARAGEAPPQLADLAAGLVDGDDVARLHLLLLQPLDHLGAQVVDGLHLRRLERQLAPLLPAPRRGLVDLHLHHLALDDLRLLLDAHADGPPERLRERLRARHLERVDLRAREHGEGGVGAQRLRHAHGDGRLARAWLTSNEQSPSSNFPFLDNSQHDTGRPSCVYLANHTLRNHSCLQRIIET
mmetsp:Transcript_43163/g.115447  ORF Transcript_43163/g.115447 Transcript_43163/m.115447 type:complete len:210 (-) Transcript_43163:78-707(-)